MTECTINIIYRKNISQE